MLLYSRVFQSLFLAVLLGGALTQVECFGFNFSSFPDQNASELIMQGLGSRLYLDAIQITPDVRTPAYLLNRAGRVFYKDPFRLWSKREGVATFNTTFVLNIANQTSPGGEGLAFILAAGPTLPDKTDGEWLGIVNAAANGSRDAHVVAIEFDTRKSYPEDLDDNHVGLDVNSISSIKQVSLSDYGVNLSSGSNLSVTVQYDGKNITVFLPRKDGKGAYTPIISQSLDLSEYLPEMVSVGFSASTSNHTQLNCILAWEFHGSDIAGDEKLLWVWITVPVVAVVVVLCGIVFFFFLQRRQRENPEDAFGGMEARIQGSSVAPRKFCLKELRKATGNFNPKNKLGEGGFGKVYKGVLANKEVAVKRVSKDSRQGKQEFIAEVTTIGSLRHKNLVKLIGWCYDKHELLIVYEYMPNGSLDKFVFGYGNLDKEDPALSWEKRRLIIYGVAQALDYLHTGCDRTVLHRDIKASNIMLDSDFNAKVGDFGLARTIQQSEKTHHSTKEIAGTPGYMAPETFLINRATVETDIYAFGVLVLEVICGRKPANQNEHNDYNNGIVYSLWELYRKDRILDAVDFKLTGQFEEDEMTCMLLLGLSCCHPNPHRRPSMKTALQVVRGEAPPPDVPHERPAFVWPAMPPSFKEDANKPFSESQVTPFTELTGR